jgi:hypothetical protein
MKRICPSLIFVARSNTPRHLGGLMNGSKPSTTSISAKAPSSRSQTPIAGPKAYFFAGDGAGVATEAPRSAWKNSLPGSTTITSDLLRKLARYASRLR